MKIFKQKLSRGSMLAFSLIIMGMMLVVALGLASISSIERKTSLGSNKSNQSFQVADSGVEKVLSRIGSSSDLSGLTGSGLACNASKNITATVPSGTAEVELLDDAGNKINCDGTTAGKTLADVRKIKSVGTFAGTTRAIEAAVASGLCSSPCVAGQVTCVVTENSGSGFSNSDTTKVAQFIDGDGVIAGGTCIAGSVLHQMLGAYGNAADYVSATKSISGITIADAIGSGNGIRCTTKTSPNQCTFGANTPCDNGWKILGFCK